MTRYKRLEEIKFRTLIELCKNGPWRLNAMLTKAVFRAMKEMCE